MPKFGAKEKPDLYIQTLTIDLFSDFATNDWTAIDWTETQMKRIQSALRDFILSRLEEMQGFEDFYSHSQPPSGGGVNKLDRKQTSEFIRENALKAKNKTESVRAFSVQQLSS